MNTDFNWRAEVLTPNSEKQAMEWRNIRRAQSPEGRFALRHLRNSEYEVERGWSPSTIWVVKAMGWIISAAIAGVLASRLWV